MSRRSVFSSLRSGHAGSVQMSSYLRRQRVRALRRAAGRMRIMRTNARLRRVGRAARRYHSSRRVPRLTTMRAWARSRLASRFRSGGFL